MIPKLAHHHSHLSNKTIDWFCVDSQELYQKNLSDPAKRKILEDFDWVDASIDYTFNSHGFRGDEFDTSKKSIMFLGASIVIGTALPYKFCWTTLIAERFGRLNYNLGISGGSNDTSFRLGSHYIPHVKPDLVVFVSAYPWRLDLITEQKFYTFYDMEYSTPSEYRPFYKEWISHPENAEQNYLKNKFALFEICCQQNIPIVEIDGYELYKMSKHTFARDAMHPGIEGHKIIASYVEDKIK